MGVRDCSFTTPAGRTHRAPLLCLLLALACPAVHAAGSSADGPAMRSVAIAPPERGVDNAMGAEAGASVVSGEVQAEAERSGPGAPVPPAESGNGNPRNGQDEAEIAERQAARERLIEESCRDERDRPASWMDRTHSYLNQLLCEPAAWFDGFFGDPRAFEETPVGTFFRLRTEVLWDETDDVRVRARLMANVSLPRVSDRLRLLVFRDEDLRGEFDEDSRVDRSDRRTRLGLRYLARERSRSRFDVDATLRANFNSLNPVVRARYRSTRLLSDSTLGRYTQTAFWEGDEGFGSSTRLDWEWIVDRRTQLRWSGQGTFSESSDGVDWGSSLVAYRQLDRRSAIRSEVGVSGATRRPNFVTDEYFVNFRYRRSFLRPWLFYELQPERAWPRDHESENRRDDWRFTATLEVQFENEPARRERIARDRELGRNTAVSPRD
jgi:hypothetical protein